MHLIVYTSEFIGEDDEITRILKAISATAKTNNSQFGITGLLFCHQRRFVQIMEGARDDLEGLMSLIEKDPRHSEIVRLVDEPIDDRSFADWNMDSFNLSESEQLNTAELMNISRVFKQVIATRSDLLARFYKAMLASHELKDQ